MNERETRIKQTIEMYGIESMPEGIFGINEADGSIPTTIQNTKEGGFCVLVDRTVRGDIGAIRSVDVEVGNKKEKMLELSLCIESPGENKQKIDDRGIWFPHLQLSKEDILEINAHALAEGIIETYDLDKPKK